MSESPKQRQCESCRFWDDYGNGETGECRRRAPRRGQHGDGCWPLTRPSDWCGQWEAKQPPR